MNIREIQDRLIGAETTIRELKEARVGPAPLRAQQLPYVHTDSDMREWGHRRGDRRSTNPKDDACRLRPEDDEAHSIFRAEFWAQFDTGPSPSDISEANQILEWVMLVDDAAERRSLRAWVLAMAGGRKFARWCRNVEHIHVMTGRRRKNRAVEKILAKLSGKPHLHDENREIRVLPVAGEIRDVSDTLTGDAGGRETGLNSWAADDAFGPVIPGFAECGWAARRNARRRQREARKRKAREAA